MAEELSLLEVDGVLGVEAGRSPFPQKLFPFLLSVRAHSPTMLLCTLASEHLLVVYCPRLLFHLGCPSVTSLPKAAHRSQHTMGCSSTLKFAPDMIALCS